MTNDFYGEFQHILNSKNQIIIPAKFRQILGDRFVISKGFHKCLFIYTQAGWNALIEKTEKILLADSGGQWFIRMFFSSVYDCEQDNNGRIVIPASLREYAQIEKDVVSIGVKNRIELWDKTIWTSYCADQDSVELPPFINNDMLQKLMELGI